MANENVYQASSSKDGIYFSTYNPVGNNDPSDSAKLVQASVDAYNAGLPLILPPGSFLLSTSITKLVGLIGAPNGKTTINLNLVDKSSAFGSQFIFQNAHFTNGAYNSNTADAIYVADLNIVVNPQSTMTIFGFANVKSLLMERVNITANYVLNAGTGRPWNVDALIDLYASVKNATISNNTLSNITYAHGSATPWAAGGGGAIWVRNLLSSATLGADLNNATENIDIYDNTIIHNTSDEALSVYCVVGCTRNVRVYDNYIYGQPVNTSAVCFQPTLVSAFPLKDPTNGANARLEDVEIYNNTIISYSWFYSVLRFGNSTDTGVICRRIKSKGNRVYAYRSTDATYSPHAQWLAYVSSDPDPDTNCLAIRAVQVSGTFGAYKNAGFTSSNDSLTCDGGSTLWGIAGFDEANTPTILGSAYYGMAYCSSVTGGNIEASSVAYYDCNQVTGGNAKTDIVATSSVIFLVDTTSGNYRISNVGGSSGGGAAKISSAATASSYINISNLDIVLNNSSAYAITNQSTTAVVVARTNSISGTMLGGTSGTMTSQMNRYGAVTETVTSSNSTAAAIVITVPSSGVAYQNTTGYEMDVIVNGGTVTSISVSRDNVTYYTTGLLAGIVTLSANDYVKVVYSAAPTMTGLNR
jgi:hypothetical protein